MAFGQPSASALEPRPSPQHVPAPPRAPVTRAHVSRVIRPADTFHVPRAAGTVTPSPVTRSPRHTRHMSHGHSRCPVSSVQWCECLPRTGPVRRPADSARMVICCCTVDQIRMTRLSVQPRASANGSAAAQARKCSDVEILILYEEPANCKCYLQSTYAASCALHNVHRAAAI